MRPFVESNDIRDDSAELRRRAASDGYLFFREFADAESILQTRRDITAILEGVGWLDKGTDPFEALTTQRARLNGTEEFDPVYDLMQRLESFHTLGHDGAITDLLERLFGQQPMLQPSCNIRVIFPSRLEYTTPPHQDFIHIQGSPDVWTAWLPLGDCPQDLGGLGVLTGSHKLGLLPVHKALGGGGLGVSTDKIAGEWVSSPFNTGDVLFFHSHTVHEGLPNLSGNRIRLSVDYRYQKGTDPIKETLIEPHQGRLSWEQVYEGWVSDKYQYYWKKFPLKLVPGDRTIVCYEESEKM